MINDGSLIADLERLESAVRQLRGTIAEQAKADVGNFVLTITPPDWLLVPLESKPVKDDHERLVKDILAHTVKDYQKQITSFLERVQIKFTKGDSK